jgi:uncharacterized membrane protein
MLGGGRFLMDEAIFFIVVAVLIIAAMRYLDKQDEKASHFMQAHPERQDEVRRYDKGW